MYEIWRSPAVGLLLIALSLNGCISSPPEEASSVPVGIATQAADIKDIAIPAGASLRPKDSLIFGQKDNWVGRLVYECSEEPNYMWNYLQGEMQKLGWTQITGVRSKVSTLVFKKEARVATIQLHDRLIYGSVIFVEVTPESQGKVHIDTVEQPAPSEYKDFFQDAPQPQSGLDPL